MKSFQWKPSELSIKFKSWKLLHSTTTQLNIFKTRDSESGVAPASKQAIKKFFTTHSWKLRRLAGISFSVILRLHSEKLLFFCLWRFFRANLDEAEISITLLLKQCLHLSLGRSIRRTSSCPGCTFFRTWLPLASETNSWRNLNLNITNLNSKDRNDSIIF